MVTAGKKQQNWMKRNTSEAREKETDGHGRPITTDGYGRPIATDEYMRPIGGLMNMGDCIVLASGSRYKHLCFFLYFIHLYATLWAPVLLPWATSGVSLLALCVPGLLAGTR